MMRGVRPMMFPQREYYLSPFERPLYYNLPQHTCHYECRYPQEEQDSDEEEEQVQRPLGAVRIPIAFKRGTVQVEPARSARVESPAPVRSSPPTMTTVPPTASPVAERLSEEEEEFIQKEKEIIEREKARMRARMELYNLKEREVKGDGNCQFRALSDQLTGTVFCGGKDFIKKLTLLMIPGSEERHAQVRAHIVDWLRENADYKVDPTTCLKDFLLSDVFPTWKDYWCVIC